MSPRSSDPRSFNTVRHSHREQRERRLRRGRVVLLAIFGVFVLLIAMGVISLIVLGFHSCKKEPTDQQNTVPSSPSEIQYAVLNMESSRVYNGELIVVNKDHVYHFPSVNKDFANPEEFTTVSSAQTIYTDANNDTIYRRKAEVVIRKEVLAALDQMMTAYYQYESDAGIQLYEAFRTYSAQEGRSVPQGYSDHHTGYLIALRNGISGDSLTTAQDFWLSQNCYKYGFIQRYPAAHSASTHVSDYTNAYRYVGVPHATYMVQNDKCLEEYVEILKNEHDHINGQEHLKVAGYEIYYVPASGGERTEIPVPSNFDYTISGDNISGFIVTVKVS